MVGTRSTRVPNFRGVGGENPRTRCNASLLQALGNQFSLVFQCNFAYLSAGFKSMNKTLVVVPTYNERENLPPLAQRLLALPTAVDMLVVDDNSPDGTGKIADE